MALSQSNMKWLLGAGLVILASFCVWAVTWQDESQSDLEEVSIESDDAGTEIPRRNENRANSPGSGLVKGRVVDGHNEPLTAHIRLKVGPPPGAQSTGASVEIIDTKTDADGAFQGPELGYHTVEVLVNPEVGAQIKRRGLKLSGQDLDFGTLRVKRGSLVRGQILNEDGAPVAGANITVGHRGKVADRDGVGQFLLGIDKSSSRQSKSEPDGTFEVAGIVPGRISIMVQALGYQPATRSGIQLRDEEEYPVEFELQKARTLTVEVRDQANQGLVSGMQVWLSALDYQPGDQILRELNERHGSTSRDGVLVFENLSQRRYRLRVFGPGYLGSKDVIVGPDQAFVKITIGRCGEAFGQIRDADSGKSIANCVIRTRSLSARHYGGDFEVLDAKAAAAQLDLTADAGLYALRGGQSAALRVTFDAKGFTVGSIRIEALRSGERRRVDVSLTKESVIVGKIRSHDYKLLEGARVTATYEDNQEAADDAAELTLMNGNVESIDPLNGAARFYPRTSVTVMTDENGVFRFEGLAAGTYKLKANHPRQQDSSVSEYTLQRGEILEDVEIQMRPAGGVRGQVLGKNGRPVAAAVVTLRTAAPPGASGGLASLALTEELKEVIADQSGRFLITGIKPGSYGLLATGPILGGNDEAESRHATLISIRIRPGQDVEYVLQTEID